jgi:hypothetical protein
MSDCEHTEVTQDKEITCDQCGQVVVESPVTITGGGVIYETSPEPVFLGVDLATGEDFTYPTGSRPTHGGMLKDMDTGEVHEPVTRHLDEFDR